MENKMKRNKLVAIKVSENELKTIHEILEFYKEKGIEINVSDVIRMSIKKHYKEIVNQ
jgi:arginine repressor